MILTVTLNPALDKTLFVRHNRPQDTLRAYRTIDLAGGKGVNVARALLALGEPARALMPLGGHSGAHVADLARAEQIEVATVPVQGQTRTALTICSDDSTPYWHYLEPGPELSEKELSRFREGFHWAMEGCHTVVISGSLPSPAAGPLVPWMLSTARDRGLRVALDAFGPHARAALQAGPWMAKPNLDEWTLTWGETLETPDARWEALSRMEGWGIRLAVLSLGSEGALAAVAGERYHVLPPRIEEVSDLGSGDSMVAGICWAAARGYSLRDCLRWGAACGAANAAVWDPGGIRREEVERLLLQVEIRNA